ncbi:hypothetical protein SAMN05444274_103371 [Mariniphaga anaerophila]|uniref:DUF2264 domain-containing protein n=1 Tax=Mariniphaga anaerophila TaxID=1484053 RepID=A0A1M4YIU9_9BACT|nr:DUF2264 domain-containing protein [Mariniphaga anaerophila]SHF05765.1 hypothetical protein SAMN05444274_103371 [Mariniphaga anaerophila]
MKRAFSVEQPDFELSPLTGMNRGHYIEMAKYLLERAFLHINSINDPLTFPPVPGKTYPQPNDPDWRWRSLEFEALERTFTLAGPLIHVEPEVEIKGIKLRDYYSLQMYNAFTPGHPNSLPLPEDLPDSTYQFTCEFGGLFKTLLLMPDTIWTQFPEKQKEEMVVTISKWAHHRTTQNNWRIFNVVALSFLKKYGYEIDDELLKSHLLWVASYHSGNGWYLEQTYNYYSISLFIVYTTIWNRTFGDEFYPEIAEIIERSARKLMESLTSFFGRNGYINMWSRSICYRTWVSGAFPVAFMLKDGALIDAGFARRLCSGSLLQFVTREEFYYNDIPSLGFYGKKEYMVQNYSCPASPFLMFLPFICLALPEDSPFWTARENEGFWEGLGEKTKTVVLENPGLVLANHGKSGASEIIPGKVYYDDPNYSKLVYNTCFPWEDHDPTGGTSMEYSFRSLDPRDVRGDDINFYLTGLKVDNSSEKNKAFSISQSMVFNGVKGGVVYRQAFIRKPPNNGVGYIIDLADIIIPGGVIRVDRTRLAFEHELTLGHFGLPHINGEKAVVSRFNEGNKEVITATIKGRSVALIAYTGWDELDSVVHANRNAEADESTVVFARKKRLEKNPAMEIMITVMLHKTDDSGWTQEELSPIKEFEIMDVTPVFSTMGAKITLSDNKVYEVYFEEIDGHRRS